MWNPFSCCVLVWCVGVGVVVGVVVEWLITLQENLLLEWLTLAMCSLIFVGKMFVFVSRPMNIVTFLGKTGDPANRVVDFPLERDTFRNKIKEIVDDFGEKSCSNNGKP